VHELNPVRCRLRVEKLFDAQRMAERYERIYWAVARRGRVPARRVEPSVNDARWAHHCPVLSDIGEPAQRLTVPRTHQGSLKWGGYPTGRTPVEYLFHHHAGVIVTLWCQGESYPGNAGGPDSRIELKHSTWFHSDDCRRIPHGQRPRADAVVDPHSLGGPARIHIPHM
jgi:hypothetical protein